MENKHLLDSNTKKTPPQEQKSEGESFVNVLKDSPDEDADFGGYYEYKGSSSSGSKEKN
jgi:hypothetical protein